MNLKNMILAHRPAKTTNYKLHKATNEMVLA